jgi:mono/diheme cytochrome c family protein
MKTFTRHYLVLGIALVLGTTAASAQENKIPTKTIKRVPVTETRTTDGQELFDYYCAVCHGKDAKGGGPAADALKKAPADLTQISRKTGGKFPEIHVMRVIKGDDTVGAHGSRDMPVWGELFRSLRSQEAADLRVNALIKYVETIQAK